MKKKQATGMVVVHAHLSNGLGPTHVHTHARVTAVDTRIMAPRWIGRFMVPIIDLTLG